jgi:hypothetical protein
MKRLILVLLFVFAFSGLAYGQTGTLSPVVPLSVPTAAKIQITNVEIYPVRKVMQVTYRWLDANDNPIYKVGTRQYDQLWTCQDIPAQLPADCTGAGIPYKCCTGVGTGTGCFAGETGFTDVFGFVIRSQDVGTRLGVGLRNLLVAKMKASISALTDVTITFTEQVGRGR